jgi:hypothetical protein
MEEATMDKATIKEQMNAKVPDDDDVTTFFTL